MRITRPLHHDHASFVELQLDLVTRGRGSLSMLAAGLSYWLAMAACALLLEPAAQRVALLVGTAGIFPLALLYGRAIGADLMTRDNPLGSVAGLTLAAYAVYWPVFVLVHAQLPAYLPHVMMLLMAAPFFVLACLYSMRAYGLLGAARAALGVALIVGGASYLTVALATAATYALALVLVRRELAAIEG